MKKILIVGKNSYIGNEFEKYIEKDDYCVKKISVKNDEWKNVSFAEYDVMIYFAGIAHSDNGKISEEKSKLYYAINTYLTINVIKKAIIDGIKQIIFMSSAIVYGASAPIGEKKIITMNTIPNPINSYGDSKLQAEKGIVKLSCENSDVSYDKLLKDMSVDYLNNILSEINIKKNIQIAIVRSPMVYGNGCKGNYKMLKKFAKILPFFPYIDNERSVISIDNLCKFFKKIIDESLYGVFLPQNDNYMNTSLEVKNIAKANGKNIILLKGFGLGLKILSKICPYVNKAFGNFVYEK